ncbi:MAG: LDCC motif putative metal-binding protein [Sedimentibacter sp.]
MKKNWFQRFLEALAKSNEEAFKGKPLDCCSLNKNTSDKK